MNYSTEVKRTALAKMLRPDAGRLVVLSEEMGIPKETLYGWKRKAQSSGMNRMNGRRKRSSLSEKQSLVLEARGIKDEDLGRWLREKGLNESQLIAWAKEIDAVLESASSRGGREAELERENKELKRDLHRKDKALAEMTALVVLKKKLAILLGEEESPECRRVPRF